MRRFLPLILALSGLILGAAAGYVLRPEATGTGGLAPGEGTEAATDQPEAGAHGTEPPLGADGSTTEYVKLNNQFVIPVVHGGRVAALVVMSVSLEVPAGRKAYVYEREPRLRDSLLQVMFDHANAGGFDGVFTESGNMAVLRRGLLEVSRDALGAQVRDVLITDLVRQDA